jgi:hypothetical protein
MRQRQRRLRISLAITALLLIGGAATWLVARNAGPPPLLTKAVIVTDCKDSLYLWTSASRLLVDRPNPKAPPPFYHQVVQLDCTTGKTTPVAIINSDFLRYIALNDGSVSPDGRRVLWDRFGLIEAFDLDGARVRHYLPALNGPPRLVSHPLWHPDGARWVCLDLLASSDRLNFRSLDGTLDAKKPAAGTPFECPLCAASIGDIGAQLLGFIGSNRVLALPEYGLVASKEKGLRLFEFNVTGQPNVREYSIRLPHESRGLNAALSPDSVHLALTLQIWNKPSPLHQWLSRSLPRLFPKSDLLVALYTVRRDDTGWRCLGSLPSTNDNEGTFDNRNFRLRWVPGGKQISFVFQDKLWKVNAE